MAKKLDVKPGAEAEAFPFANFDEPRGAGGEGRGVGALRHEEYPVKRDRWAFFAPNPLERRSYEGFKEG